jgi:hypothetical protein
VAVGAVDAGVGLAGGGGLLASDRLGEGGKRARVDELADNAGRDGRQPVGDRAARHGGVDVAEGAGDSELGHHLIVTPGSDGNHVPELPYL